MSAGLVAVDPGASSGFAVYPPGSRAPTDWGQVRLHNDGRHTQKSALRVREIVEAARDAGCEVLVIEGPYKIRAPNKLAGKAKPGAAEKIDVGWRTYHSMGASYGRWVQEARAAGLRVVEVNPRTWQAATVGTGPRKQQIPKYKRLARKVCGSEADPPADASAAIVIGRWAVWQRVWDEKVQLVTKGNG